MRVKPAEVGELLDEIRRDVPTISVGLGANLSKVVGRVIEETGNFNAELEKRIDEAGKMPGDAVATLMIQGALSEIFGGLPEQDTRQHLFKAGRIVGKFMARKYREKIAETMAKKMGGN